MIDFVFNFLKRLAQIWIGAVQNLMIIINTALSLVILYLSNVTMLTSDAFTIFSLNQDATLGPFSECWQFQEVTISTIH